MSRRWSEEDRQRFADGDRLKAQTVRARKKFDPTDDPKYWESLMSEDPGPDPDDQWRELES